MTRKKMGRIILVFIGISCWALRSAAQDTTQIAADTAAVSDSTTIREAMPPDIEDEDNEDSSFNSLSVKHYKNINKHNQPFTQRNISNQAFNKAASPPDDFWYVHEKPKEEKQQAPDFSFWQKLGNFLNSNTFKTIVWIIVGLIFITIITFFVLSGEGSLFRTKGRNLQTNESDAVSDNIFEIDFAKALQKAGAERNYPLCVRLLFLKLLKTMNEAGVIIYEKDKTNFNYLFALSGSKYFNGFAQQIRNYEYVWYGKFLISNKQFDVIKKQFEEFSKTIKP